MKKIKAKFFKQIQNQKKINLQLFHEENVKLKKGERTNIKYMSRKKYNEAIDYKEKIIEDFYENKLNEISNMSCSDFIINFLNKESKENIKALMNTNLNIKFELNDASTNISKEAQNLNDKDDIEIDNKIKKIDERMKMGKVRKYINCDLKIKNFFPYEQKKLRKNENKEKINELFENREIFDMLKELTQLNEQIIIYEKENKDKEAQIRIKMKEEGEDEESFGDLSEEEKNSEDKMEIE